MRRIKYEFYALREAMSTAWWILKETKSIKNSVYVFTERGEFRTLKGAVKKGSYYTYKRDFWFNQD